MKRRSEQSNFMVPLNSAKSGHLVFVSEIAGLTILTDPALQELACGSFEQDLPRLRVEEDAIMIQGRDFSALNGLDHSQIQSGAITLNPSIPWEIEFRGRVSNLQADLRELELRSLDLLGGAGQVELLFPQPINTSFIYITGGIEDSAIHVPAGVGIRVQAIGSVNDLLFDDRHFETAGGKTSVENAAFKSANNQYDICIAGSISHVTIDR